MKSSTTWTSISGCGITDTVVARRHSPIKIGAQLALVDDMPPPIEAGGAAELDAVLVKSCTTFGRTPS